MSLSPSVRHDEPGPTLMPPVLMGSGLTKRFGRKIALDGASVVAQRGETVALVGENGAGKSTLLRICAGLLAPDEGRIEVIGRVGYCPQVPGVIDLLTTREHLVLFGRGLGLGRADALARGREVLARLGFHDDLATQARHLSGGNCQKLNLALALLGQPDILLLDEPYQGFDHGTYVNFWDLVAEWRDHGCAVVIVTHLLAELHRVDRVIELHARHQVPTGGRVA